MIEDRLDIMDASDFDSCHHLDMVFAIVIKILCFPIWRDKYNFAELLSLSYFVYLLVTSCRVHSLPVELL